MASQIVRNKFLIAAFLVAILMWPLDAAIDAYRFHAAGFIEELFRPPGIALFHRTMLSLLVFAFGIFVHWTTRHLYRNEERLNHMLSSVNGGLWEWSLEKNQCDCSLHLISHLLGYGTTLPGKCSPDGLCSLETWADLIHPDEKPHVAQAMKDVAEGKREWFEDTFRMRHKDGGWRHIRFRAFPESKIPGDKPTRIFGTYADTTEHKKLEADFFQKAEQLSAMLVTTSDGYWLCDKTGHIIDANSAYCDMVGFPLNEVIGSAISDFEIIETREEVEEHVRKVLIEGFDRFETRHRCKDGKIIDVEVSVSYMDKQEHFISFFRNITERNKNKEELLRLSRVVEQTAEAVMIVNKAGIIEYVNPAFCRNTGYTFDEAVGQNPSLLKSGAQDDEFYAGMWATISKGESWSGSVVDQRKDGSFFPALLSITPIHNDAGEHIYYVGMQQDITELKRLENQLVQSQKMEAIGTLVGGIAHDFNNLLAAIEAGTFLAKRKINSSPDDAIKRLDDIEILTRRAASMIKQMLAFARKDTLQLSSISLNSVLIESLKLARPAIPSSIELVIDFHEDDLIINGDSTQIQQIILNLLNNARDAGTGMSQPRIECTLQPFTPSDEFAENHPDLQATDQLAHLTIRDNGSGIAKEHLDRIFEPFFSTKGVGKGTGLGLAMVFGTIKAHSGLIEVESQVGKGTTFHIYLPLIEYSPLSSQAENTPVSEGAGETILVVDDEESVRTSIGDMLESLGYTVIITSNGLEAIEKLKDNARTLALMITDIVMPKMSGIELAKTIRESGIDIPIIIMTGYDREILIEDIDGIDRSIIVKKPFPPQDLSQAIHSMLGND